MSVPHVRFALGSPRNILKVDHEREGYILLIAIQRLLQTSLYSHVAWPRAQPLGQSVSLKFSLETRLGSECSEPLIDFLAFLVQKL